MGGCGEKARCGGEKCKIGGEKKTIHALVAAGERNNKCSGSPHRAPRPSQTPLPVLLNISELAHASAFAGADRERILLDDSAPTAFERVDGNWGPAARRLGATGGGAGATVASLAAEFDRHLAPSIRQPRTRADYWRA
jgi:hypothetical protein